MIRTTFHTASKASGSNATFTSHGIGQANSANFLGGITTGQQQGFRFPSSSYPITLSCHRYGYAGGDRIAVCDVEPSSSTGGEQVRRCTAFDSDVSPVIWCRPDSLNLACVSSFPPRTSVLSAGESIRRDLFSGRLCDILLRRRDSRIFNQARGSSNRTLLTAN